MLVFARSFWKVATLAIISTIVGPHSGLGADTKSVVFLDQGWTSAVRQEFYTTSQGSQIMPYGWFRALERSDSTNWFAADGLRRHGYVPNTDSRRNPDRLPVGFAIDKTHTGWWIGMTCAACHTNQITYGSTTMQIDGGPALADMYALLVDIGEAFRATLASVEKFDRFARHVLRDEYSPAGMKNLRVDVSKFLDSWQAFVRASTPSTPWGPTRLDAFGMIFNRVAAVDLDLTNAPVNNNQPPNAPVSYPFLWGASWHDKVQWNGSAPNTNDVFRLARNVGEVLGVFARTKLTRPTWYRPYYRTTVRRANQLILEDRLKSLTAPAWPTEILGQIDKDLANAGKDIFMKKCAGCHGVLERDQQLKPVKVRMVKISAIGTDQIMATNACKRAVHTGRLEGAHIPYPIGKALPSEVRAFDLVSHVTVGAILEIRLTPTSIEDTAKLATDPHLVSAKAAADILNLGRAFIIGEKSEELRGLLETLIDRTKKQTDEGCGPEAKLMAYKARPLNGIWATAPYLHNGSVPNLFELLLPAAQRTKIFNVGNREFDSRKVGFVTTPGPGTFALDTAKPGNANTGHDIYGEATMTDKERWQLIEYMKTL